MIPEDKYIFIQYGFDVNHQPQLTFQNKNNDFIVLRPIQHTFSLEFDTTVRYCIGWQDLKTGKALPCPKNLQIDSKFEQCRYCLQKTGFNPVFYHTDNISKQQAIRNEQPHNVYLAHFAPNVIKVGISWANRGIHRLLDQGARAGLMLKTCENAYEARQHEATIAKLSGVSEALQVRFKQSLLKIPYKPVDARKELQSLHKIIVTEFDLPKEEKQVLYFDSYYLGSTPLKTKRLNVCNKNTISGKCLGLVGSFILMEQDDWQFSLALRPLRGYYVKVTMAEIKNQHEPQQISLF